jgi:hypothetical protein
MILKSRTPCFRIASIIQRETSVKIDRCLYWKSFLALFEEDKACSNSCGHPGK